MTTSIKFYDAAEAEVIFTGPDYEVIKVNVSNRLQLCIRRSESDTPVLLKELCAQHGLNREAVRKRIKRNLAFDRLIEPVDQVNRTIRPRSPEVIARLDSVVNLVKKQGYITAIDGRDLVGDKAWPHTIRTLLEGNTLATSGVAHRFSTVVYHLPCDPTWLERLPLDLMKMIYKGEVAEKYPRPKLLNDTESKQIEAVAKAKVAAVSVDAADVTMGGVVFTGPKVKEIPNSLNHWRWYTAESVANQYAGGL